MKKKLDRQIAFFDEKFNNTMSTRGKMFNDLLILLNWKEENGYALNSEEPQSISGEIKFIKRK